LLIRDGGKCWSVRREDGRSFRRVDFNAPAVSVPRSVCTPGGVRFTRLLSPVDTVRARRDDVELSGRAGSNEKNETNGGNKITS